jgi:predicted aconitase/predicted aconitase with swiveling domain
MTDALQIAPGLAEGDVILSDPGLSFWGGVDAATGVVIDAHHPLCGQSLAGKVVLMPTSRGSCTGSGVLLELVLNGHAPAALVFREAEDVLTLGALIAGRLFDKPLPVLRLGAADFAALARAGHARITPTQLLADSLALTLHRLDPSALDLTDNDIALLRGDAGQANALAMEVLCQMAAQQGATRLCDITRGHIDGCIYASPANLRFAAAMRDLGAQVRVPTTMNAISVEHGRWQAQGTPPDFGGPAAALADAYVAMGARPTFTCAPYLLDDAPARDEMIGWSESNAVIYANTALGARTVKHPDFLDLFIAMTGRAPLSGVYLDDARRPARVIAVEAPAAPDDAFWPMLGWMAGALAPDRIPLLTGLDNTQPTPCDLKAMCAAFGSTSGAAMLHVAGVTPEANLPSVPDADHMRITKADLVKLWAQFNAAPSKVDLVAIGSPHASAPECRAFAHALAGRKVAIDAIVTLGAHVLAQLEADGTAASLRASGVQILQDLCWCSISEPVFPPSAQVIMTNSGKYAHYGPGLTGRQMRFGSLADCAAVAISGQASDGLPDWLG